MKRVAELACSSSEDETFPLLTAASASDFVSDDEFSDRGGHSSDSDEEDSRITAAEFEHQIKKYGMGFKPEILPVYDSDTSDEDNENTCGDVPARWYDEYDHVGYTVDGNKIARGATKDEVDKFLENSDSRDVWRTVLNEQGESVKLTGAELQIVDRIERGLYGDASYDPFEKTVEWFTSKLEIMPLSAAPEPKRRFIPSKNEAKRIMKLARAIRKEMLNPTNKKQDKPRFYDIWGDAVEQPPNIMHISAPKMQLPGNELSYNPPAEYLQTEKEIADRRALTDDEHIFIPRKYASLRQVPLYERFIQDRFERCLDLYLCPRMIKKRIQIDPESLIPKLPSVTELEPFPTKVSVVYKGHASAIESISFDPSGFWLASAADNTVRVWEVKTGRCAKTLLFDDKPKIVAWNPNADVSLLAVVVGNRVFLCNPQVDGQDICDNTDDVLSQEFTKNKNDHCAWSKPSSEMQKQGHRVVIETTRLITSMSWHRKGDYFVTVASTSSQSSSLVHQTSKWQSQNPFQKTKGLITSILFHPLKPFLFIARNVRVYNLLTQQLMKKLITGVKWISSMAIHPLGDNLIITSFDKRLCWFDMDLSTKPYKTLRYHNSSIRDSSFSHRYPMFASCGDDGNVNVFHGSVYSDLMMNPLIVPLVKLGAHAVQGGVGVTGVEFHPIQPWLVSCGADGLIKLFT